MEKYLLQATEALWGKVQSYAMPFQDIYRISAYSQEGYVIPLNYKGKAVSQKALSFGTNIGDILYFASGETMSIIEYELIQHGIATSFSEKEKELLKTWAHDIEEVGKIDLSDYFGSCPPPNETLNGIVEDFVHICNGIYFVKASGVWLFGVCSAIAYSEMSELAIHFGGENKDYLFYDLMTAAIAIYELALVRLPVRQLVVSEAGLHALLERNFPLYTMVYNTDVAGRQQSVDHAQPHYTTVDYLSLSDRVGLPSPYLKIHQYI